MKVNLRKIRKCHVYPEDFKHRLVSDFESGKFSIIELTRLHKVSGKSIYRWIYKFSTFNETGYRVIEMKTK